MNTALQDEPQLVNQSPFENGWLFEIEIKDAKELGALMDHTAYEGSKESH